MGKAGYESDEWKSHYLAVTVFKTKRNVKLKFKQHATITILGNMSFSFCCYFLILIFSESFMGGIQSVMVLLTTPLIFSP